MVSFDLTGKKAIVTGSTRGLGRGMAEGLLEAGAEVVIMGTSQKAMEIAAEHAEKGLNAVFMLCQLAGRKMIKQGYGKIINVASMLSFFGGFTVPAYAASKGAVAQLTKALSNEWASKGINVNAIAPGYMATDMNTALINDEGRSKEILGRIPAKRWGNGEDMKGITIFLASQASDYLSGAVIPVDGGYLSK